MMFQLGDAVLSEDQQEQLEMLKQKLDNISNEVGKCKQVIKKIESMSNDSKNQKHEEDDDTLIAKPDNYDWQDACYSFCNDKIGIYRVTRTGLKVYQSPVIGSKVKDELEAGELVKVPIGAHRIIRNGAYMIDRFTFKYYRIRTIDQEPFVAILYGPYMHYWGYIKLEEYFHNTMKIAQLETQLD